MSESLDRDVLLGGRRSIAEIAKAFNFANTKPILTVIRKHDIPITVVGKISYVDPAVLMAAMERPATPRIYRRRAKVAA